MITSTKNYSKKKKEEEERTDRTLGQMVKQSYTKSHKEAYKYALRKSDKGKIYIYKKKDGREQPNQ